MPETSFFKSKPGTSGMAGLGGGIAAPHSPQNFAVSVAAVPHLGHSGILGQPPRILLPQLTQKLEFGKLGVLHLGQRSARAPP